jgi:hypothetical protein
MISGGCGARLSLREVTSLAYSIARWRAVSSTAPRSVFEPFQPGRFFAATFATLTEFWTSNVLDMSITLVALLRADVFPFLGTASRWTGFLDETADFFFFIGSGSEPEAVGNSSETTESTGSTIVGILAVRLGAVVELFIVDDREVVDDRVG